MPRELVMYEQLLRLPELMKAKEMSESVYTSDIMFRKSVSKWVNIIQPSIKLHFGSWKTWTSDDIADWIVGLENGRFRKYETMLRQEMKTAKVEGRHLPMLTQNITYLQRFGIVEFDEEIALQQYIQQLLDGKLQSNDTKVSTSNTNTNSNSAFSYRSLNTSNTQQQKLQKIQSVTSKDEVEDIFSLKFYYVNIHLL